jgi:hypothetical protein
MFIFSATMKECDLPAIPEWAQTSFNSTLEPHNFVSEAITDERANNVCNEKDFQVKLIDQLNIKIALGTILNIMEAYD